MTTETAVNVNELQAGSELDRLVAEKVMGYQWRDTSLGRRLASPDFKQLYSNAETLPYVPAFSTEIAAAWQVVEKLRLVVEPWGSGWCTTNLEDGDADLRTVFAAADTAPLAICRGALKVVTA